MSVRFRGETTTLIEDYAHHPAELSALMDSLLKMKGERRIHVVFQPHRYARLKKYFNRFVRELRKADKVTVLPVFSAWCPDDDINSQALADELNRAAGQADFANFAGASFDSIAERIARDAGATLLAIVGAGDCDKLVEKTVRLLKKSN
jgi:UDP-N-acetylmuramate--alanine ligase